MSADSGTPRKRKAWNAGLRKGTIDRDGYLRIDTHPVGAKIRQRTTIHRMLMEEHLGRKLEPWEVVHHIDENKLNNAIENLEVLTVQEHMDKHFKGKPLTRRAKLTLRFQTQQREEIKRLRKANDALAAALRMMRDEYARLPHSLGYSFTHLPKIDEALAAHGGKP